eukprot:scaffold5097_cov52-Attheya_sp.AAC.12
MLRKYLSLRTASLVAAAFFEQTNAFQMKSAFLHVNTRGLHSQKKTSSLQMTLDADDVTNTVSAISNFYETSPFLSAFLTCGAKASAADFVAQKRTDDGEEKNVSDIAILTEKKNFEGSRNLAFLLYGGLYQGMAQELIYNHFFPIWFGQSTELSTVATKVTFDMLILTPFLCLPIAYFVKAIIFRYSMGEGLERYWYDVQNKGLLLKYWSLWCPVQFLTFGIIPPQFRIAFIAFVSFFWLIILSSISARQEDIEQEA